MATERSLTYWLKLLFPLSSALLLNACGGSGNGSSTVVTPAPTSPNTANEWVWMSGADQDVPVANGWPGPGWGDFNSNPYYGTKGTPSPANVPGGRNSSAYWTDRNGNFWLFGGDGLAANLGYSVYVSANEALLNDLWMYSPATNEWTWEGGSSTVVQFNPYLSWLGWGQAGAYGTEGTPNASNIPGSRMNPVSWTDSAGNFWLFGGEGYDSVGTDMLGNLNDLWQFNPATMEWTWISGSNTFVAGLSPSGVYGTKGTPAPGNVPPGLTEATGWVDNSDNLWLFGGTNTGMNNTLWEFNPASKEWTWVSGDAASGNGTPVYGTLGVPAPGNVPGCRQGATSWTDGSGNLWLFGGFGCGPIISNGQEYEGPLNDLWEFNPSTKQWTCIAGITGGNDNAAYGTLGVAAAGNTPAGLQGASGWTDSNGNLWLFGGFGVGGLLNDLWKFNLASKQWAWMGGGNVGGTSAGPPGVYGVEGKPAAANTPGGRYNSAAWMDNSGNLWLFAGDGMSSSPAVGGSTVLNDLWRYQP